MDYPRNEPIYDEQSREPYLPILPKIARIAPIKPDRRASEYQISYAGYQESNLAKHLYQNQIEEYQAQIHTLEKDLRKREQNHKQQAEKYYEKIVLMGLEIVRVRSIMIEQAENLESMKKEWLNLENIFSLKFEHMKIELQKEFEQELLSNRQKTQLGLNKLKDMYVEKISTLLKDSQEQKSAHMKTIEQLEGKLNSIGLLEIKYEEVEKKNKIFLKKQQRLEELIERQKQQISTLQSQNSSNENDLKEQLSNEKQKSEQLFETNRNLLSEISQIKQSMLESKRLWEEELIELQRRADEKGEHFERLKYELHQVQTELNDQKTRCQTLEDELEEFKNRKTQRQSAQQQNGTALMEGARRISTVRQRSELDHDTEEFESEFKTVVNPSAAMESDPLVDKQIPDYEVQQEAQINQQLQGLSIRIEELQREVNSLQNQLEAKNDQINSQSEQLSKLSDTISQKQVLISQKQATISEMKEGLSKKEEQLMVTKRQIKGVNSELQKATKQKQSSQKEVRKLQKQISTQKVFLSEQKERQMRESFQNKIQKLEAIVNGLSVDWGQKQRNQNGIFRQVESTYKQQILLLEQKNEENQKLIVNLNEMMADMAAQIQSLSQGKKKK